MVLSVEEDWEEHDEELEGRHLRHFIVPER